MSALGHLDRRRRERQAAAYIRWVRPIACLGAFFALLGTHRVDSTARLDHELIVLVVAAVQAVLLASLVDQIRTPTLLEFAIAFDFAGIAAYVALSSHPEIEGLLFLWVLLISSYFSDERVVITYTALGMIWTLGFFLHVDDPLKPLIPAELVELGALGSVLAYVCQQTRASEESLQHERRIDASALAVTAQVRANLDLDALLAIAARVLCETTNSRRCIVRARASARAFEWHSPDVAPVANDLALDEDFRALMDVDRHHSSASDPRPVPGADDPQARTVAALLGRLKRHLGPGSPILVVPMRWRDSALAHVVLVGPSEDDSHDSADWSEFATALMERIEPQFAAGVLQATIVHQQQHALRSLQAVERMRERLIANVSHELRTPLTSINGFVDTLLRPDLELDDETRVRFLEHIRSGGQRLSMLVEDLLVLGTAGRDALDLQQAPFALGILVENAVEATALPEGRTLRVEVDEEMVVSVDEHRMTQVIDNLVSNAIKHGEGAITVTVRTSDGGAELAVFDEGPGVAAEHVDELFLPFARFSQRTDSTGLGLAISKAIVEAHDGQIGYRPALAGRGHCFFVRLPPTTGPRVR